MIAPAEAATIEVRTEAFAARIHEILNSGALAIGLAIGHRTGLFDALDGLPPATSESIAERAGLDERYVREWLGSMVTGGLVAYDPTDEAYQLPPEHAAVLTRRNSPNNLAVPAQFLPLIAGVQDEIVDCFRNGGGIGCEQFAELPRQAKPSIILKPQF